MLRVIRFSCLGVAFLILTVAGGATATRDTAPVQGASAPPTAGATARFNRAYGKLPLSSERNEGQTDARVKFLSRGNGYTLFLTPTEAVLALRKPDGSDSANPVESKPRKTETEILRVKLVGADRSPQMQGWIASREEPTTSSARIRKSGARIFDSGRGNAGPKR